MYAQIPLCLLVCWALNPHAPQNSLLVTKDIFCAVHFKERTRDYEYASANIYKNDHKKSVVIFIDSNEKAVHKNIFIKIERMIFMNILLVAFSQGREVEAFMNIKDKK